MKPADYAMSILTSALQSQYGLAIEFVSEKSLLAFRRHGYRIIRESPPDSDFKRLSILESRRQPLELWIVKDKEEWLKRISSSGPQGERNEAGESNTESSSRR